MTLILISVAISNVTGGLLVFLIFRKTILNNSPLFQKSFKEENAMPDFDSPEGYEKVLTANTDFTLYKNTNEAIEKERQRIGSDIHDELGHHLSALNFTLSTILLEKEALSPKANRLLTLIQPRIQSAIQILRGIIHNVLPPDLENKTLAEAINELCIINENLKSTRIIFQNYGESSVLTNLQSLYLYRIIQELLNNSIKHSCCFHISIALTCSKDELKIAFCDDGIGLPKLIKRLGKYGLRVIFSRSETIGATAKFNTPLKGMEFEIRLPLNNSSPI